MENNEFEIINESNLDFMSLIEPLLSNTGPFVGLGIIGIVIYFFVNYFKNTKTLKKEHKVNVKEKKQQLKDYIKETKILNKETENIIEDIINDENTTEETYSEIEDIIKETLNELESTKSNKDFSVTKTINRVNDKLQRFQK